MSMLQRGSRVAIASALLLGFLFVALAAPTGYAGVRVLSEDRTEVVLEVTGLDAALAGVDAGGASLVRGAAFERRPALGR